MKVCVIDDDPLMLEHVAEMVSSLSFEVVTADNVDTGLRLIEAQGSDAAVVDILMPDRDGLTFIMEARKAWPQLHIVAISGGGRLGAGSLLSMAGGLGANATLIKPFSNSDLAAALGDGPVRRGAAG